MSEVNENETVNGARTQDEESAAKKNGGGHYGKNSNIKYKSKSGC